jgi:uncharacterized Tic20 family protein
MSDASPPVPPEDAPPPPPPGPAAPPPAAAPQPMSQSDERLWAMLSHLSYFVLALIAPLIIMLTLGTRSAFVRSQSVEALNFHITLLIASVVGLVLSLIGIGIILLVIVWIGGLVLAILASIKSYGGEDYRYPVNIRLVK